MSKKRVLHLNNPLKWNLDIYEDDTPGFRIRSGRQEPQGYKILLVFGLLLLTAVLWAFLWNQAEIAMTGR